MRYIIFCIFISTHIFCQKIEWKEDLKLKWNNFKSESNIMNNSDIVAYAHCGWEYSAVVSSDKLTPVIIKIEAIFIEDKSWKDDKKISDYSLLHEQKHFDIAEIFARKLRREVSEKIISSADYIESFYKIYNKITKEYNNFQSLYDQDTKNGTNKAKQKEYNSIIINELELLKDYK